MRNSLKGALLSGLVFPGIGQIAQKNFFRGAALMIAVSWCLFQLLVKLLRQVNELFEQIKSSGIAISTDDILGTVIELMPEVDGPSYQNLMLIIAGCWVVSVIDAYLAGRKIDADEQSPGLDLTDSIKLEESE